jgi:hypothetical protein
MPKYIVHYKGYFFEWSSVVDAPVTEAMNQEEFEEYYKDEYGANGMQDLPKRLKRAINNGTSCIDKMTVEECIEGNRAGKDGTELSFKEVLKQVGIK